MLQNKSTLTEKRQENDMVRQEFALLKEDAVVYKLVGPVLAKQDLSECKGNVQKRLEYIDKEIARQEQLETDFQSKVTDKTNNIKKMQNDLQRMVMQAQQAAQQAAQQQQTQQVAWLNNRVYMSIMAHVRRYAVSARDIICHETKALPLLYNSNS